MREGQPVESILGGRKSNSKGRKYRSVLRKCWVMQFSVDLRCMKVRSGTLEIWMDSSGFCVWYTAKHFTRFISVILTKISKGSWYYPIFFRGRIWGPERVSRTERLKGLWSQQMAQPELSHPELGLLQVWGTHSVYAFVTSSANATFMILNLYSLRTGNIHPCIFSGFLASCLPTSRYSKSRGSVTLLTSFHHSSHRGLH